MSAMVPAASPQRRNDLSSHLHVLEELWGVRAEDIYLHEEDPVEREREEVRPQQAVVVDNGAPAFADAAGRGEAGWRETAEDASEDVVGQGQRQGHGLIGAYGCCFLLNQSQRRRAMNMIAGALARRLHI